MLKAVFKRSFELGCIPLLKKPICQWNNQNWRIEAAMLVLPTCQDGKTQQIRLRCAEVARPGKAGILRIKKKTGQVGIADIALTIEDAPPTDGQAVMGIDLGVKGSCCRPCERQGHALLWQWTLSEVYAPSLLCASEEASESKEDTRPSNVAKAKKPGG